MANIRVYHHLWHVAVVVHGDDFVALGDDVSLSMYQAGLRRAFELGDRVRLGMGRNHAPEVRTLNRILCVDAEGLRREADPRHTKLLGNALGLSDKYRPIYTSGKKPIEPTSQEEQGENDDNDDDPSTNNKCLSFRSLGTREPQSRRRHHHLGDHLGERCRCQ